MKNNKTKSKKEKRKYQMLISLEELEIRIRGFSWIKFNPIKGWSFVENKILESTISLFDFDEKNFEFLC